MTSPSQLRKGDRVAVAPGGSDWSHFRLGVVQRVLNQGANVLMDDAKTATDRRGLNIPAGRIRLAYQDDGRWVAERERREEPREEPRRKKRHDEGPAAEAGRDVAPAVPEAPAHARREEREVTKTMPEKPDSPAVAQPSAAQKFLDMLVKANIPLADIEAAVAEARREEAARARRAAVEAAEAEAEERRAQLDEACRAQEKVEQELAYADELVRTATAQAAKARAAVEAAREALRAAETRLAAATRAR